MATSSPRLETPTFWKIAFTWSRTVWAALARLFAGLVLAAVEAELPHTLGIEQTAASLASLFLDGARRDGPL